MLRKAAPIHQTSPSGAGVPGGEIPVMAEDDMSISREVRTPGRALLSVVVPCFNEEMVVGEAHRRLVATLENVPALDFELIYVDDGSRDATLDLLRGLHQADPRARVLALSRNFGQPMATTAGLVEAVGDAAVVIDADLQDPPDVIPEMLELWRQGVDVAYGVRTGRAGETPFKRWTSKLFHKLMSHIADVSIPLDAGDFRLMDRKVVDAFVALPERDRFLRGMIAWVGFRQEPVRYHRVARCEGETKWPFAEMLRLAVDGIVSFSFIPLRLATWVGFLAASLALLGIVYAVYIRIFTDTWITGWTAIFITILFLGGVQLVLVGVLGEYLGRIYGEVKRRPLYLVKERLGFEDAGRSAYASRPASSSHPAVREGSADE